MRVVTFATNQDEERLGVWTERGVVDVAAVARASHCAEPEVFADVLTFLRVGERARSRLAHLVDWAHRHQDAGHLLVANEVRLLAPIPRPPKILCLAGNYAEHWREGEKEAPPKANHTPEVFIKPATTIVGPDAEIRLPGPICSTVDYEGELAVVIGRSAKNVSVDDALAYVAGYANFNDISGRRLTIGIPREPTARAGWFDWLNGKWFDTFGPLGPFLVLDEVVDPQSLSIQTRVNGEVRQNATTADMIFSIAETISWISQFLTLEPGDVIATGTPSGVGSPNGIFLKAGDAVEVEVAGLGILKNTVVAGHED